MARPNIAVALLASVVVLTYAVDCGTRSHLDEISMITAASSSDQNRQNYDKYQHPNARLTGGTVVRVKMFLTSLEKVDEKSQQLVITGYFQSMWNDTRLQYKSKAEGGCYDKLDVHISERGRFWQPNLYVDNSAKQEAGPSLFQVDPSGHVYKSERMRQTLECPMNFNAMPFDVQHCKIVTGSYTENTDVVAIELVKTGWAIGAGVDHAEWDLMDSSGEVDRYDFEGVKYDLAHLKVTISRKFRFFFYSYVVNSILFVLISYSGFYINRTVAPARVAISVIPVLIMRVLDNSVKAGMPKIDDFTWLTSFLLMAMIYCQCAVFEYGMVWWCMQKEGIAQERFDALKEISARLSKMGAIRFKADASPGDVEAAVPAGERNAEIWGARRANSAAVTPMEMEATSFSSLPDARQPMITQGRSDVPSKTVDLNGLSGNQIIALDMAFCAFATHNKGVISRNDLKAGLRIYNKYYTQRQVAEIFEMMGLGPGEDMDARSFVAFLRELPNPPSDPQKEFNDHCDSHRLDLFMRRAFVVSFGVCVLLWAIYAIVLTTRV